MKFRYPKLYYIKYNYKTELAKRAQLENGTNPSQQINGESRDCCGNNTIIKPGLLRQQEMQRLYGEGCSKIVAMETAIQLTFDRNFDTLMPSPWPYLPLK